MSTTVKGPEAKDAASRVAAEKPVLEFGGAWDYAPAPESKDHVRIESRYGLFINGAFVPPKSRKHFDTINPATEEKLAEVAEAGAADVDAAVRAAEDAHRKRWSKLKPAERGKYIYRIARLLQEKSRELAVLETMNGGKPIKESRDVDVPLALAHFFYHAGWADKLEYAFPRHRVSPIGVCGQIIPWNFPLLMAAWKIAPALACGNTVVFKPAETTPLTAMHLAKICQEADLPPGVVNILPGAGETGAHLVNHPRVKKIAFTGSTEVGKLIQRATAGTGKRLTLELGGKAANIVFEDAAARSGRRGHHQRHLLQPGARLLRGLTAARPGVGRRDGRPEALARIETLRLGDPLDKNTDVGAINSKMQLDKIRELVACGVEEGAGIHQSSCAIPKKGFWFPPTFFTGVAQSHRIAREEIFGPVLAVMTFRTPDEAVEKANNIPYGLSAGVWTDKGSKIFQITSKMRAGVVWANTFNKFDPSSPFGGYKESGFGREGGVHGLRAYVELS